MEMNPVPVIAAERNLLQIITAITVAVAAAAMRHFPYCILDLRINSSKLVHLACPEISLRAESLKQVLLHLFFSTILMPQIVGLFILIPSFYRGGNRFTLGMGLVQGYMTSKCQLRLHTGLPTTCRILSSLYLAVSDTSLLFLFVISVDLNLMRVRQPGNLIFFPLSLPSSCISWAQETFRENLVKD